LRLGIFEQISQMLSAIKLSAFHNLKFSF
jgi:hypothetical protein